jgi:hypothetical protein
MVAHKFYPGTAKGFGGSNRHGKCPRHWVGGAVTLTRAQLH